MQRPNLNNIALATNNQLLQANLNRLPNIARSHHTVTLLPFGRVLVAGGYGADDASFASVEICCPTTGFWNFTGSLSQARFTTRATLLPGGKVPVAEGCGDTAPLTSKEICDPTTGSLITTGSLKHARMYFSATLLQNSKILAIGSSSAKDEPAIVNTSVNVRGEPIVCTPAHAYACFMRTKMDCLVVGQYIMDKGEQPERGEERDWREKFELD